MPEDGKEAPPVDSASPSAKSVEDAQAPQRSEVESTPSSPGNGDGIAKQATKEKEKSVVSGKEKAAADEGAAGDSKGETTGEVKKEAEENVKAGDKGKSGEEDGTAEKEAVQVEAKKESDSKVVEKEDPAGDDKAGDKVVSKGEASIDRKETEKVGKTDEECKGKENDGTEEGAKKASRESKGVKKEDDDVEMGEIAPHHSPAKDGSHKKTDDKDVSDEDVAGAQSSKATASRVDADASTTVGKASKAAPATGVDTPMADSAAEISSPEKKIAWKEKQGDEAEVTVTESAKDSTVRKSNKRPRDASASEVEASGVQTDDAGEGGRSSTSPPTKRTRSDAALGTSSDDGISHFRRRWRNRSASRASGDESADSFAVEEKEESRGKEGRSGEGAERISRLRLQREGDESADSFAVEEKEESRGKKGRAGDGAERTRLRFQRRARAVLPSVLENDPAAAEAAAVAAAAEREEGRRKTRLAAGKIKLVDYKASTPVAGTRSGGGGTSDGEAVSGSRAGSGATSDVRVDAKPRRSTSEEDAKAAFDEEVEQEGHIREGGKDDVNAEEDESDGRRERKESSSRPSKKDAPSNADTPATAPTPTRSSARQQQAATTVPVSTGRPSRPIRSSRSRSVDEAVGDMASEAEPARSTSGDSHDSRDSLRVEILNATSDDPGDVDVGPKKLPKSSASAPGSDVDESQRVLEGSDENAVDGEKSDEISSEPMDTDGTEKESRPADGEAPGAIGGGANASGHTEGESNRDEDAEDAVGGKGGSDSQIGQDGKADADADEKAERDDRTGSGSADAMDGDVSNTVGNDASPSSNKEFDMEVSSKGSKAGSNEPSPATSGDGEDDGGDEDDDDEVDAAAGAERQGVKSSGASGRACVATSSVKSTPSKVMTRKRRAPKDSAENDDDSFAAEQRQILEAEGNEELRDEEGWGVAELSAVATSVKGAGSVEPSVVFSLASKAYPSLSSLGRTLDDLSKYLANATRVIRDMCPRSSSAASSEAGIRVNDMLAFLAAEVWRLRSGVKRPLGHISKGIRTESKLKASIEKSRRKLKRDLDENRNKLEQAMQARRAHAFDTCCVRLSLVEVTRAIAREKAKRRRVEKEYDLYRRRDTDSKFRTEQVKDLGAQLKSRRVAEAAGLLGEEPVGGSAMDIDEQAGLSTSTPALAAGASASGPSNTKGGESGTSADMEDDGEAAKRERAVDGAALAAESAQEIRRLQTLIATYEAEADKCYRASEMERARTDLLRDSKCKLEVEMYMQKAHHVTGAVPNGIPPGLAAARLNRDNAASAKRVDASGRSAAAGGGRTSVGGSGSNKGKSTPGTKNAPSVAMVAAKKVNPSAADSKGERDSGDAAANRGREGSGKSSGAGRSSSRRKGTPYRSPLS